MSSRLAIRIGGAALSLAALAACSDPVTAPVSRAPTFSAPTFAVAATWPSTSPIATTTAEVGSTAVCNAGPQSASFTASKTEVLVVPSDGLPGTDGTLHTASFTLAAGTCTLVSSKNSPDDAQGTDNPIKVTVNMTANFASVSFAFAAGDGCPAISPSDLVGSTVAVCYNNYHGSLVTFTTTAPPPPPGGCTYTKGWYRNNGSNTVVAVDGRSKADAQAIFNATPGKPGDVTWEGDNNTLNLYQQLLAAILNGGLNGPQAVKTAIANAQAATGGTGQNITLVPGTDVSALIDALTYFNEGNYAGWPHCS